MSRKTVMPASVKCNALLAFVPRTFAEVVIFTETPKVLENCLSAFCDGNNVIDVKHQTKVSSWTSPTGDAAKAVSL